MTWTTGDIRALLDRGVEIPDPGQVWIDARVDLNRIGGPGTVLYPGTRIMGERTFVAAGAQIGLEGPATVDQSWIGPGAVVASGFCQGAVLLAAARVGTNAHVRGGTILEEGASTAHAVGLKQTILFPFVTLGSLINFCDCFMSGGTGPADHSEVGSSYIHFNFTPHQDKATASLIGDVPSGVMLDRRPVFLGGQGGMVGPCRLAFGTVAAAGTLIRKDELRPGRLLIGAAGRQGNVPYKAGGYRGVRRILVNNLTYIGNLMALATWYRQVRRTFVGPQLPLPLWQGLVHNVEVALDERIRRLEQLGEKIETSDEAGTDSSQDLSRRFVRAWPAVAETLSAIRAGAPETETQAEQFLETLEPLRGNRAGDYIQTISALPPEARDTGRAWLQRVVDRTVEAAMARVTPP